MPIQNNKIWKVAVLLHVLISLIPSAFSFVVLDCLDHHPTSTRNPRLLFSRVILSSTAVEVNCKTIESDKTINVGNGNTNAATSFGFIERVKQLETYKGEHGDCLVPKRYKSNPSLGNWVNKQRQHYRKFNEGKNVPLSQERIEILKSVGFVWDASSVRNASRNNRTEAAWWRRLEELTAFIEDHGNTNDVVPLSNSPLGFWIIAQRNAFVTYNDTKDGHEVETSSTLTTERVEALNSIGFDWKTRRQQVWDQRIQELEEYKKVYGDCMVPVSYVDNPKLANWVSAQRKRNNKNALPRERVQQLQRIGFVWNRWDYEFEKKQKGTP